MSDQQPRAYNYVTDQDFSANASSHGGGGATNTNAGYTAPTQYVQEQQQHYTPENDMYRPNGEQQHYYPDSSAQAPPLPQSSKPHGQYHSQQSAPAPPTVNIQSHPHGGAPPINNEYKPPPMPPPQQQQQQYQPAPYGDPSQQWGQVSFDEKFKPPSDKPKWNDVSERNCAFADN
jgi:hypothetical protein